MLQSESLLNDIRKGLSHFQTYIESGQGVNLTDTNVRAEDFVAGLLNCLFGWQLKNTNDDVSNYPCIDLIDQSIGCGIQVTAEKGSAKLKKTIQCLVKHELAKQIQSLKVFCLVRKQGKYTVNDRCSGVQFDWRKDVLDFNDVVKEATRLSDLHRLKMVWQQVVESFPSIFPEFQARVPSLTLPATDPEISWLTFSSKATKLVGRDDEMRSLCGFLRTSRGFSWRLILGSAGSGKSRLALELCEQVTSDGWAVGFLNRTEHDFKWSKFNPVQKTLVVIDYVASRAEYVSDAILNLSQVSSEFRFPVRVLLLERNTLTWWPQFIREESPSESASMLASQCHVPMVLQGLDRNSLLKIAKQVAIAKRANWEIGDAESFSSRIQQSEFEGRPLYAMILAEFPHAGGLNDLLKQVLAKECGRRTTLVGDDVERRRMEHLLLLATMLRGVVFQADGPLFQNSSGISDLLPSVSMLDEHAYCDFAGSAQVETSLSGLQPDLLGERFVLDSLCAGGILGQNAARLFHAACRIQPDDVVEFAVRAFVDFEEDSGIRKLFDFPSDVLELRIFRAKLLSQLFAMPRAMFNRFLHRQLDVLIAVADCHREEVQLQELTATAEYNLGCSSIFSPMSSWLKLLFEEQHNQKIKEVARSRFDAVISRTGGTSRIGVMALLNRGTLFDDEEKAIECWTTVIQADAANDETRACALNNRANSLVDRADHEGAIRDRTNVILLEETSADRRFVALFRRAESYAVLKKFEEAANDLTNILKTDDISNTDKLHARVQRGVYLNLSGLSGGSRKDFIVINELLQQASHDASLLALPEAVRCELASLVQAVLDGTGSEDTSPSEPSLQQLSLWNSSHANRQRVSKPKIS